MSQDYLTNTVYILVFLIGGSIAALAPFLISYLIRPKRTFFAKTRQAYECGMDPFGSAWDFRYGISYYIYALMFLAFDVDILYLLPVVGIIHEVSAVRGIFELSIFIFILSLGLIYAWVKGAFDWKKISHRKHA
ncbi:MAG: NADH-quinone oxidoreductase subunit A [Desulfobacter sp.]